MLTQMSLTADDFAIYLRDIIDVKELLISFPATIFWIWLN